MVAGVPESGARTDLQPPPGLIVEAVTLGMTTCATSY